MVMVPVLPPDTDAAAVASTAERISLLLDITSSILYIQVKYIWLAEPGSQASVRAFTGGLESNELAFLASIEGLHFPLTLYLENFWNRREDSY